MNTTGESTEAKQPSSAKTIFIALVYPLCKEGVFLLVAVGIISLGIRLLSQFVSVVPFGGMLPGILNVMLWGSVLGYVLQVITKTADGEDAPPGWQDIGDWSDILRPVFLLLAVVVISFGPAVAWSVALSQGYVHSLRMFWILVLWGCFYFPMALTATAMMDSLSPLNPVVVLLAILRAGWMYLFACSTLAVATIGTYWLADALSEIPYLTTLISAVGSMYLLMVTGRICGLIYRLRREKLDWPCE